MNNQTLLIPSSQILAGKRIKSSEVFIDQSIINAEIDKTKLEVFITDNGSYIVEAGSSEVFKGRYIVKIQGNYSLNKLKRISNNKICVDVMNMDIEFDINQIEIIGRVICNLNSD